MSTMDRTENDAVIELAKKLTAETIEISDDQERHANVLVLPQGMLAVSVKPFLDEYMTAPVRRKGTAILTDLASFIALTNRFKDTDSAIFVNTNPKGPALLTVFDYHHAGDDPRDIGGSAARFGEHRAQYSFPLSDEWKAWTEASGKPMDQALFAEFIERRLPDISDPAKAGESSGAWGTNLGLLFASASTLLELSKGLAINVDRKIAQKVNLQNGVTNLSFTEDHTDEAGAAIKVPGAFLIGVPVFRSGAPYEVIVRLRYRVSGQRVHWIVELQRVEIILDHAIREAYEKAGAETELPVFLGAPEA